jgi:hypothetical protein
MYLRGRDQRLKRSYVFQFLDQGGMGCDYRACGKHSLTEYFRQSMRRREGLAVSLKSIGWCALCACIGAVAVTAFSQGGQPPPQPNIRSSTATSSASGVTFLTVSGANPGGYTSVTVQTTPRAECSIRYFTPHGTISRAKGLVDQTSDSNGNVSWTWKIGSRTEPGAGSVTVTCNGACATTKIEIGY